MALPEGITSGKLRSMTRDEERIHQLPCWTGNIGISVLKGGLSNINYVVADAGGKHVVRFGRDYPFHHVSREREVMVARAAHAAGFGPEVKHSAQGVMVTEFLGAETYDAARVRGNAMRIGKLLREFHTLMPSFVTGPGFMFWVFHVIRDYVKTLEAVASPDAREAQVLLADVKALEAAQVPLPIIFSHDDLLPGNILDDGTRLWLIDFEYAGFGTAMFDLANASSNALMDPDQQGRLLSAYFGYAPGKEIRRAFAAMECASLLRESLWAMISGFFLHGTGVDYAAYTTENLARYHAAREQYQMQYGSLNG